MIFLICCTPGLPLGGENKRPLMEEKIHRSLKELKPPKVARDSKFSQLPFEEGLGEGLLQVP
jgi:hypothetical protein